MPVGGTAFFGQNQSPRITTTYLNQLNRKGDPAPGAPVSTAQVSGSIVQPYAGFEGGKLTITDPFATMFADPAVGPLYGGVYMYVQFAANAPTANARGQIVYWSDILHYVVTDDPAASTNGVAGVTINATTAGNWDFIQIAGIAEVSFSAAAAIGTMLKASGNQAAVATVMDNTYLGTADLTAGVAGAVSPVLLNIMAGFNY